MVAKIDWSGTTKDHCIALLLRYDKENGRVCAHNPPALRLTFATHLPDCPTERYLLTNLTDCGMPVYMEDVR